MIRCDQCEVRCPSAPESLIREKQKHLVAAEIVARIHKYSRVVLNPAAFGVSTTRRLGVPQTNFPNWNRASQDDLQFLDNAFISKKIGEFRFGTGAHMGNDFRRRQRADCASNRKR